MKTRDEVPINECPVSIIPTEEEIREEWKILTRDCKEHKSCFLLANTTLREVMRGFARFVFYRDTRTFTIFRLDRYDSTEIIYCPYCGKKLPDSLRDEHWACLQAEYGYPYKTSKMPPEFKTDEWWLKRKFDDPKVLAKWREKHKDLLL